jgi:hypothetical protein
MVLRPDSRRLQSHSDSQDFGRNGMSPSGGVKMRKNRNEYRACSTAHRLSILLSRSQTLRKSAPQQPFFSSLLVGILLNQAPKWSTIMSTPVAAKEAAREYWNAHR